MGIIVDASQLPMIPGISVDKLPQLPTGFSEFQSEVKKTMLRVMGCSMTDMKSEDVFVVLNDQGKNLFYQVDFGEYGMYHLVNKVMEANQAARAE